MRGSKLYKTCDCIKRNGLQMDCQRTECIGRSCGMSPSASCNPGASARRLADHVMGKGGQLFYPHNTAVGMQDVCVPEANLRGVAAQYSMGGVGDGNYIQPDAMNYHNNYGGPAEAYTQFMPPPQAAPYGACLPSGEVAGANQFADYGPTNIAQMSGMPFGDYAQG